MFFLNYFQAHINKIKFEKDRVIGSITWNDTNENQDFLWNFPSNPYDYEKVIE